MNKRLIVLISFFAFIVLIIVLSSTVFSLRTVQVNFLSTTNYLENEIDIISSANFSYGESIFFIDREVYTNEIEQNNPYIKVVSLEVVFPNRLIIHAVERNEMYAFKLSDNSYAITDDELKVLSIKPVFVNTTENAILVNSNLSILVSSVVEGAVLPINVTDTKFLTDFSYYSQEWDNHLASLRGNIKEIILHYEQNDSFKVLMRQGVEIIITKQHIKLNEKIQTAYSVYDNPNIDRTKGIILVIGEQDGDVVANYDYSE